jgi:putative radical SAM enzyme (TIGR03279 family)
MAVKISGVIPHSPAEKSGLKGGDTLISIGSFPVNDVLDYMFYIAEESVSLTFERDGVTETVHIKKSSYDDIGLLFDTFLMDEQKSCKNNCIFCFIDQNPKGMRESLYYKDDDARLSFLHGNYITLTNLEESDIDRIIKMRLGINISLHTMNPELRAFMMRNRFAGEKLRFVKKLTDAGISLNLQLVLCPGINDGKELDFTLSETYKLMPNINSIACVPVGLTRHRADLFELRGYDKESAADVIDIIEGWQAKFLDSFGTRCVYPSDEFFLKVGRQFPSADYYEEYSQYQNGVGMVRAFTDSFLEALDSPPESFTPKKYAIAVGTGIYEHYTKLLHRAVTRLPELDIKIFGIVNNFFGETITVTGLLTGGDIAAQLDGKLENDRILLLSEYMFRKDTEDFLDDTTKSELENKLGVKIEILPDDGKALFDIITS